MKMSEILRDLADKLAAIEGSDQEVGSRDQSQVVAWR